MPVKDSKEGERMIQVKSVGTGDNLFAKTQGTKKKKTCDISPAEVRNSDGKDRFIRIAHSADDKLS